jgi:hypothetical protein
MGDLVQVGFGLCGFVEYKDLSELENLVSASVFYPGSAFQAHASVRLIDGSVQETLVTYTQDFESGLHVVALQMS